MLPLFLILGIAAAVTYAATSSASSSSQAPASAWPPGPQFNALLSQEVTLYQTNLNGGALTAAQQAQIAQMVASGPAQYQATLHGGTPTIPGYQQWFWNQWALLAQGGGVQTNPYASQAQVSGRLWPVFVGLTDDGQQAHLYQDLDGNLYMRGG